MIPLLTAEEMRDFDKSAIALGIPELVLMEHAAMALFDALKNRFRGLLPQTSGLILAGPGNNGGDALALARLCHHFGIQKIFVAMPETQKLSASCQSQLAIIKKLGLPVHSAIPKDHSFDWAVDGLLGTGLGREVTGLFAEQLSLFNQLQSWRLAIDIPSGLSSETGVVLGTAAVAHHTVTLGFWKRGLTTAQAAEHTGIVSLATIQIPRELPQFSANYFLFDKAEAKRLLPHRPAASHKGHFGHVGVCLGELEKQGASLLSTLGALSSGVGLVTLIGEAKALEAVRPRLAPEVMTATAFDSLGKQACVVIGPGLGTSLSRWDLLKKALALSCPLVLDADATTLISSHPDEAKKLIAQRRSPVVLTPHPKEASRLLACSTEEVENDRFHAARTLTKLGNVVILLKGKGTIVASPESATVVVTSGNSGLAKGGSGDCLSGILAGLIAQGVAPHAAGCLAAYLHGKAAEHTAQEVGTERAFTPCEVLKRLPQAISAVES